MRAAGDRRVERDDRETEKEREVERGLRGSHSRRALITHGVVCTTVVPPLPGALTEHAVDHGASFTGLINSEPTNRNGPTRDQLRVAGTTGRFHTPICRPSAEANPPKRIAF